MCSPFFCLHCRSTGAKPESPNQRELNSQSQKSIQLEKLESRNKVDIFENAFRKIKEATGVSDVNEVIQKIVSQESTTENLIAVTRENQGKIEALNQLRKQIKTHCEDIKYSGANNGGNAQGFAVPCSADAAFVKHNLCVSDVFIDTVRCFFLPPRSQQVWAVGSTARWSTASRTSCPTAPLGWSARASSTNA
jgi:hypothetical protein